MKFVTRTTRLTVLPVDARIFDEMATEISIEDDAGGEYVAVKQLSDDLSMGLIRIDPEEWPTLRDAIDTMVKECRSETDKK